MSEVTKFDIECKTVQRKILRAEINVLKDEIKRIQKQIDDLEVAKKAVFEKAFAKEDEAQQIAEWLDEQQYEYFKANGA